MTVLSCFKDVLKNRKIGRISVLTGKQRDNQGGLLPLGMEPELGSQVLSVLLKNMKRGNSPTVLGKVSDDFAPLRSKPGMQCRIRHENF